MTVGTADGDAVQAGEVADHAAAMPRPMISAGTPSMVATRLACGSALFLARVQQHDDEDEQHHHRAGINDDLHGGDELGAQQQINQRQRAHHHDQRQRAVDGVLLHQEVDRPSDAQRRENEEQNKRQHDCLNQ